MYAAAENGTEDNPQEGCRTKANTHDGTENRAQTGDVEELHKEDTPRRHRHKVHTVCFG